MSHKIDEQVPDFRCCLLNIYNWFNNTNSYADDFWSARYKCYNKACNAIFKCKIFLFFPAQIKLKINKPTLN